MADRHKEEQALLSKATPLVRAVYYDLRHKPEIDILRVYRRLCVRFPREGFDERHVLALEAVGRFFEETRSTTHARYTAWAKDQPLEDLVPSGAKVVRLFGTWTRALLEAGVIGRDDPRALRLLGRLAFTEEEVLEAVALWASQTDAEVLMQKDFLAWARKEASSHRSPPCRLPLAANTLLSVVGYWEEILEKIGESDRTLRAKFRREGAPGRRYTREQMGAAVHRAAGEVDGPLTYDRYVGWRAERRRENRRARIPGWPTFKRRGYAEWADVLLDFGIPVPVETAWHTHQDFTQDHLLEALVEAIEWSGGLYLSRVRYDTEWRPERMRERSQAGVDPRTPTARQIAYGLGANHWVEAVALGLQKVGRDPGEAYAHRHSRAPEHELREALIGAMLEYGPGVQRAEYEMFREQRQGDYPFKLRHYNQTCRGLGAETEKHRVLKIGTWTGAKRAVMDDYLARERQATDGKETV